MKHLWIKLHYVLLCMVLLLTGPMYCGLTASAADAIVDSDVLEDDNLPKDPIVGTPVDPDKTYEFVESTVFNEAGAEVWALTKSAGMTVTPGQTKSDHSVIKFETNGVSKYPEVYFWNEKAAAGRHHFANLFASTDASQYEGIRIWLSKPETNKYQNISIMLGQMYTGYWPSDTTGFFTYTINLPRGEFEGYVYLPFDEFVNKAGAKLSTTSSLNFIAVKYNAGMALATEAYIGELALYKEGTAGVQNSGRLNIGQGFALDSAKEYEFFDSIIFNESTDAVWALSKNVGYTVTTGVTDTSPVQGKTSIKFATTGEKPNPEIYFWNERNSSDRMANGVLFGTNVDMNDYEGLRLWVKTDDTSPYTVLQLYLGRMYTGYWPTTARGFYTYNLVVYGGFEGYVNIPFENFVNNLGVSLPVEQFNFVGMKYNDGKNATVNTYVSDLCIYREKVAGEPENDGMTIGVKLDPEKKYEILTSKVFGSASQKMWDETKIMGMEVTAGVTDAAHIPAAGKTSVQFHTTGEKSAPDVYFWNEQSVGDRRTHGKFWGSTDCTEFDGVRFWIEIPASNTYSKLTMSLGQMYTGYWPKNEVGFFSYDIVIPRGGYKGYVNVPFSSFRNLKDEALNSANINFLVFKYNETGFKVSDFWFSDLSMYRVALPGEKPEEDSEIVDGEDVTDSVPEADGTVTDDVGDEYKGNDSTDKPDTDNDKDTTTDAPEKKGINWYWIFIPVVGVIIVAVLLVLFLLKKKKNKD